MPLARKAVGTTTEHVHNNQYVTCTYDLNFQNVVLTLHSAWRSEAELGGALYSKRLRPHHFDEDDVNPTRTYLILHSWMLWRSTRDGCKDRKACRANKWLHELDKLRSAISALGSAGGGTGNRAADTMIKQWCPCALLDPPP